MCYQEMQAMKGMKALSYLVLVMLLANFFQIDLVKKNRWKEMEMVGTSKSLWVIVSTIYLHIDFLLFFAALVQTDKLLVHFKEFEKKCAEEQDENEMGVVPRTEAKISYRQLFKEYFRILLFRAMVIWPPLLFCLFGLQSVIFYIGTGSSWTEYQNLYGECDKYWWTPLLFVNDLIPFFSKDLFGCMRWTAIFAIEMKLFLLLPPLVYLYHKGK